MPPVTGANTCATFDPMPEIESFATSYLSRDGDLDYVPTSSTASDVWEDSGINKEPRAERLYLLGKKEKLDGALMYWFKAVGTQ